MVTRRRILLGCGVVGVGGLSGCGGRSPRDTAEAKARALSAEEDHIRTRLTNASCVDDWGLQAVGVTENATVTSTTRDAVYVEVKHPYSYNINGRYGDVYSVSTYAVRTDTVERIEGTEINPC